MPNNDLINLFFKISKPPVNIILYYKTAERIFIFNYC